MTETTAIDRADHEKSFVALSSVAAAVVLTSLKIVVGVSTGSLGVLSEAAHSGLDLVAAVVTYWAVRVSSQPADSEHTYGHGKFENISALFETVLLLVTCGWILYEAVERLFFRAVHVDPSAWAFATMGVSIVIDFSRSRALARVAKKYQSQALEADALHFSTDIWSSAVVIAGLLIVRVGDRLGVSWLAQADAVAATVVAGIVVWVSLKLGKKSLDDLLDAVPAELQERARRAAWVQGVVNVSSVRLRRSGPQVFVDLVITVPRGAAFERAHDIASAAEASVHQALPGADVVVHIEPVSANEDLLTTVRVVAARLGHGAHAVRLYDGGRRLELHLEVDEGLKLREAHERATSFEQELRRALPDVQDVTTHIEPAGLVSASRQGRPASTERLRDALSGLQRDRGWAFEAHQLEAREVGEELDVSFHCILPEDTWLTTAHELTDQLEQALREWIPGLGRVVIHVEPPGEDESPGT